MPGRPDLSGMGWAWGVIRAAVNQKATTADLWAGVRAEAARLGVQLPPGAFRAVTYMRGLGVRIREGARRFDRSGADQLVTPDMAPLGINARPAGDRDLLPQYKATFQLTYLDRDETEQTRTVSMIDTWGPEMTVGDVQAALWESAEGLAQDYGISLVGWDSPQLEMI